jgi:hypothetical protein
MKVSSIPVYIAFISRHNRGFALKETTLVFLIYLTRKVLFLFVLRKKKGIDITIGKTIGKVFRDLKLSMVSHFNSIPINHIFISLGPLSGLMMCNECAHILVLIYAILIFLHA